MIVVKDLYKNYGTFNALKGLNLHVEKGDIYGFLGRNGAGKSTTLNILTGLIKYQSGEIAVNGLDIRTDSRKIMEDIGYLTEEPQFYDYMSADEYLTFIGRLKGQSKKEIFMRTDEMIELVGLEESRKRKIKQFSKGMRQRMGLAAILYSDPTLLLLDEPSSALDPQGRKNILDIIQVLKDSGKTIFFSSHILSDVQRICNKVGIIDEGKLILESSMSDLKSKYTEPIVDLEASNLTQDIISRMNSFEMVQKVVFNNNSAEIYLKDHKTSKDDFFRAISKLELSVLSYNVRQSTLEDIFIRMVK